MRFDGLGVEAHTGSAIHAFDPRVKLVVVAAFITLCTLLTSWVSLALAVGFLLALTVVARLRVRALGACLLWIMPLAGVTMLVLPFVTPGEALFRWEWGVLSLGATREGCVRALVLSLRVLTAALAVHLLVATTGLRRLLAAMSSLGLPPVLVQLLDFTVRYLFVVGDELRRMQVARAARGFRPGRHLFHRHTLRTLGQTVGLLFIRSWERGERVYQAMLARGYTGKIPRPAHPPLRRRDLAWGAFVLAVPLGLRLLELGGPVWLVSWK